MPRAIRVALTFLIGGLAGFFLAGPLVLADGPMGERVAALSLAASVYLLLGAASGWWLQTWTAGLWLAAPGLAIALLLGEEWPVIGLTMGVLWISAVVGAWLGAQLRSNTGR